VHCNATAAQRNVQRNAKVIRTFTLYAFTTYLVQASQSADSWVPAWHVNNQAECTACTQVADACGRADRRVAAVRATPILDALRVILFLTAPGRAPGFFIATVQLTRASPRPLAAAAAGHLAMSGPRLVSDTQGPSEPGAALCKTATAPAAVSNSADAKMNHVLNVQVSLPHARSPRLRTPR
jgi:hypothetical protein